MYNADIVYSQDQACVDWKHFAEPVGLTNQIRSDCI